MLLDLSGVPSHLHPKLRIFLSADIVGSTALKQPFDLDNTKDRESFRIWAAIIESFYQDAQKIIDSVWLDMILEMSDIMRKDRAEVEELYLGSKPVFWKTVGDEVIFWKDLTEDIHIWFTLCVWLEVISRMRSSLRKKGIARGALLDIKCTGWLAGFPVRNKTLLAPTEVEAIPFGSDRDMSEIDGQGTVDFIGPAIDIGFRLSQWATSNSFIISTDLAYFLAATRLNSVTRDSLTEIIDSIGAGALPSIFGRNYNRIEIHFGGMEFLKGVLGGMNYPRFWINTHFPGSLDQLQSLITSPKQTFVPWDDLEAFCKKFYAERKKFLFEPFIYNEKSFSYKGIHRNYKKFYEMMTKI